ncbi:MAG: hypothetical protein ACJ76S_13690 [Solirubrobacteraceae bacterium]
MNPESAPTVIAALRIAVGGGAWLTPNLAARLFGLDPDGNPQAPYLGRLFGVRDVALAAGTLASEGKARRSWLAAGLACDVADTAAALLGRRAGYLSTPVSFLLAAPALAAVGLGIVALSRAEQSEG